MKYVIAVIQPDRIEDVLEALNEEDIHLVTASDVMGRGRQKGIAEIYRSHVEPGNLLRKVKLEIAVNDDFVSPTITTIARGPTPATSATARSSCSTSNSACASAPARPARSRSAEAGGAAAGPRGSAAAVCRKAAPEADASAPAAAPARPRRRGDCRRPRRTRQRYDEGAPRRTRWKSWPRASTGGRRRTRSGGRDRRGRVLRARSGRGAAAGRPARAGGGRRAARPAPGQLELLAAAAARVELLVTVPYHTRSAEALYERFARSARRASGVTRSCAGGCGPRRRSRWCRWAPPARRRPSPGGGRGVHHRPPAAQRAPGVRALAARRRFRRRRRRRAGRPALLDPEQRHRRGLVPGRLRAELQRAGRAPARARAGHPRAAGDRRRAAAAGAVSRRAAGADVLTPAASSPAAQSIRCLPSRDALPQREHSPLPHWHRPRRRRSEGRARAVGRTARALMAPRRRGAGAAGEPGWGPAGPRRSSEATGACKGRLGEDPHGRVEVGRQRGLLHETAAVQPDAPGGAAGHPGVVGHDDERLAGSRQSCSSRPMMSSRVRSSRLPVGSSARITRGSLTSARAIATRCCSPPVSSEGMCLARSARPTPSRASTAAGGARRRRRARVRAPSPRSPGRSASG